MTRPTTLTIAVVLQWIAAALLLIAGIIMLFGAGSAALTVTGDLESALKEAGIPIEVVRVGILGFGIFMIVLGVISAVIALSLARGHAWARIVLTVFSVLAIVSGVLELFNPEMIWRGIAGIILQVIFLWLMWNASSSTYIAAKGLERRVERA